MKTYTIKKKRDGQGWKEVGTIYASSWHEAKKQFTHGIRIDLSTSNNDVIYINDEVFEEMKNEGHRFALGNDYEGPGYYDVNGGYWNLPLLDDQILDTYSEDVYTWTIKRV